MVFAQCLHSACTALRRHFQHVSGWVGAVDGWGQGGKLDGEGGATIYGGLRPAKVSVENRYLPLGLSNKARLIKPVLPDQVLTFDDVELDANRLAFQMRRETEALLN